MSFKVVARNILILFYVFWGFFWSTDFNKFAFTPGKISSSCGFEHAMDLNLNLIRLLSYVF